MPVDLAFARAYPVKTDGLLPWYVYLAPVGLAVSAALAVAAALARAAWWLFGVGFFLVNVVLSQFVLLIDNYAASRYVYLPYVGLFLILADLVERGLRRADPAWLRPARRVHCGAWVCSCFAVATIVRAGVWRDTVSVMSDSIAKEPGVAFVHNSRGIALYKAGDYPAALADFDRTIQLDPTFTLSLYYRGLIRHANGDHAGALADFDQVVAAYPGFAAGLRRARAHPAGAEGPARARWPTSPRRSSSTRTGSTPTTTAGWSTSSWASSTRRWPTSRRRSPSTRASPRGTSTGATPGTSGRPGRRLRRLGARPPSSATRQAAGVAATALLTGERTSGEERVERPGRYAGGDPGGAQCHRGEDEQPRRPRRTATGRA